jgi:electron transfer flavoprotein alpha subunit
MSKNLVVIAEARSGTIKRPSLEAVSAAKDLVAQAGGEVIVLVAGSDLEVAKAELASSGAAKVIALESSSLGQYCGDAYAEVLIQQTRSLDPAVVLMPHTAMGRDLMPRVAAALQTGLVTDAVALHHEDGAFGATKPIYAGKAYLRTTATTSPFMATLRPNNFEARPGEGSAEVSTVTLDINVDDLKAVVTEVIAAATDRVPLQEAKVVVSGGRGLKDPDQFYLVEDLAAAFGPGVAAVGASRAVVDAGWRPHREQVGQTGKVVSPSLYIACGISGAIQHLAGMRTARCIVAINKDPEAPIFKVADYGIVGDAAEVLPSLTAAVKAAVNR